MTSWLVKFNVTHDENLPRAIGSTDKLRRLVEDNLLISLHLLSRHEMSCLIDVTCGDRLTRIRSSTIESPDWCAKPSDSHIFGKCRPTHIQNKVSALRLR